MNKSIPREFIDKLIEMSDIVGIIGTYVDLRQSSGQYRSKCPFHDGDNITTFSVFEKFFLKKSKSELDETKYLFENFKEYLVR